MDYLNTVPTDVLNIISSFLDDRSKRRMRSTSTIWWNVINYDNFTIYFARSSTLPELIRTFSRYSKPFGLRFEKVISIDDNYTTLASLTNLTRLQIILPQTNLPNLDLRYFGMLTNLKRFSIGSLLVPYLQYPNLTKLEVSAHYNLPQHLDGLKHLTKLEEFVWHVANNQQETNVISKFGNPALLKSVTIVDNSGNVTFDEESVSKMSSVSKVSISSPGVLFPFSKLPNLESLTISSDRFDDLSTCTKLTSLDLQVCGAKRQPQSLEPNQSFQQLTALYNLKALNLSSILIADASAFDSSILSRLTDLESLPSRIGTDTLEFINSTKLTRVFVRHLKASHLSHLTNLQRIEIAQSTEVDDHSIQLQNVTYLKARNLIAAPIFPNLKKFECSHGGANDSLSNLTRLSQLESLSLDFITNNALQLTFRQTRLTELSVKLNEEHYDLEDLDQLTHLKNLGIFWRKLSTDMKDEDQIWQAISNMTDLEELSMFHIDMKSVSILSKLPKLKQLFITGKTAAQFDEVHLSVLTNLQVLRLEGDGLIRRGAVHQCKLQLPYLYSCHPPK